MKCISFWSILFAKVAIIGFSEYKALNQSNSYTEIEGNLVGTECPIYLFFTINEKTAFVAHMEKSCLAIKLG